MQVAMTGHCIKKLEIGIKVADREDRRNGGHCPWIYGFGFREPFCSGLRASAFVTGSWSAARAFRGRCMIYLTAVVAAFTFGYLLMAMIRPEWF
jgi:hypothetical protein